ncbi:hypothetical protein JTB14_000245 [Gonioctena quinquepunctata]|nr:hypothetical protein JTB14_000245 [Gonioctena quinquepunctata]
MPEISKGESKKPNLKEYFEKRAEFHQQEADKAQSLKELKANPEETGKNKTQTPPKNAAAKAPLEKSPLQIAFEKDLKEFKEKEAEHKRELEFYRRRKELHKLQRTKSEESAVDEYFEHLSESAMEERNEQRKFKERRNTLSPDDISLEDEYFNYLASSDDETTSEEYFFSDGGTYLGQTITPRYAREEIRSLKDQNKENTEIKNQEQEKNVEEEIPHIFPNVIVLNEPMDTQDVVDSPVSEDINDKIPITKKGKKNKKKEELPKITEPPPIILEGKERAVTSKTLKGKQEKPNMKEYLEKRAEIFKEAAIKKGQKFDIEEKLKKERGAAKRTPSVAVEPPLAESDYEDEYFSHPSSIESEEESEQESEKFRETEKIFKEIAENKIIAQNLPKSTQAGPAGRSHEMPAKPNGARRK